MNTTLKIPNLDQTTSYHALKKLLSTETNTPLTDSSIKSENLTYNFSHSAINNDHIELFQKLVDEMSIFDQLTALLEGESVNTDENRPVSHYQLRNVNSNSFYSNELDRLEKYSLSLRKKSTIKHVIQIGIGGSYLGPEFLANSLAKSGYEQKYTYHFFSSIDPIYIETELKNIDLTQTLFIIASKSGSTHETLACYDFIKDYANATNQQFDETDKTVIITSSSSKDIKSTFPDSTYFYIDDSIGGRFSITSTISGLLISVVFGFEIFKQIIMGANKFDQTITNRNLFQNMALMYALINIYERSILNTAVRVILPYSYVIKEMIGYIEQTECESNGKNYNRYNQPITYPTSPLISGGTGTEFQHSISQLLHEGTDALSLHFFGVKSTSTTSDAQKKLHVSLNEHLVSQILSFKNDYNKTPINLFVLDNISPESLGNIVSLIESSVMFEGFLWNLNSFHQPGVLIGKEIFKTHGSNDDEKNNFKTLSQLLN